MSTTGKIRAAITATALGAGLMFAGTGLAQALPANLSYDDCNNYANQKNWEAEQRRDPTGTQAGFDRYECVPDVTDVNGNQLYKVIITSGHI
ncbi:hypothetical protein ACWF9G_22670 [Nocardia sp. NPDC055029]